MNYFKKLFQKQKSQQAPSMMSWEQIVDIMYNQHLDAFADEVIDVIYSSDRSMRYVILKDEKGLFTYQLEAIYQFDEDEWQYISSNNGKLPAMWEPFNATVGMSFFENIDELLKEMKSEPEYKQYF